MDRPKTRGYILHPDFAHFLLKKRIGNPWDLHLIDIVQEFEGWGAVVFPEPVQHSIHPEKPGRGSGRFTSILGGPEDASTEYVLLLFDRSWGVSNRVRTMVWAMMLAISHRLALVMLWGQSKAFNMPFRDIFPDFEKKQETLLKEMEHEASPG